MNYARVRKRPSQFESVTSVTREEFDDILSYFTPILDRRMRRTTRGTVRLNKRSFPETLPSAAHVLFFILTYFKLNPLQEQHGASFDMSQESVSRWFRIGEKCLNETMHKMGYVPHRQGDSLSEYLKKKRIAKPIDEQNQVDGEHYFIDGFDRSIQRPKCSEEQDETYSGKHHRNTVKHTCISDANSEIMYLGDMRSGSVHDKRMADEEELSFPDESFLWKDLGYLGFLPDNVNCFEPYKTPKGGELTKWQKAENQAIAAIRIVVEHAIGGLKRCRIVKEITRIYNYEIRDRVVETCAALHNLRLRSRKGYKRNVLFNPV